MRALELLLLAVSSVGTLLAAISAARSSSTARQFEKGKITIDLLGRHRAVLERTWASMSAAEKAVLHHLDWSTPDPPPLMKRLLEFLNSGEYLAEAWRAGLLDLGILYSLEINAGANYLIFSRHVLPVVRDGVGQPNAFVGFEDLLRAWWIRLPESMRRQQEELLAEQELASETIAAAVHLGMIDELAALLPHMRQE